MVTVNVILTIPPRYKCSFSLMSLYNKVIHPGDALAEYAILQASVQCGWMHSPERSLWSKSVALFGQTKIQYQGFALNHVHVNTQYRHSYTHFTWLYSMVTSMCGSVFSSVDPVSGICSPTWLQSNINVDIINTIVFLYFDFASLGIKM